MYGGAATNLAAAVGKILITVVTVGSLIIEIPTVHEVDSFTSLQRELSLVSADILAESNVVLLEEIMIVQGGTVFEPMLPSTYDAVLRICRIRILSDCKYRPTTTIISEHVIGSFVSIRNLNL